MSARLVAHLPASWPFEPASAALAEIASTSGAAGELVCVPAEGLEPAESSAERFVLTADNRPAVVGLAEPEAIGTVAERLLRRPALILAPEAPPGSAAAYLAGLAIDPNRLEQALHPGRVPVAAEAEVASLVWPPMLIEAPIAVLRRIGPDEKDLAAALRERVLAEDGMPLSELTLRPVENVGTRVFVNDLVIPLPDVGQGDGWREVVAGLDRVLTSRLHWLLRADDVRTAVEELSYLTPDLARAVRDVYSTPTLTAVLRERLRRGGRLRNLGRLLWLLLDLGPVARGHDRLSLNGTAAGRDRDPDPDPVELASRLNKTLIEDAWRIGRFHWPERVGRLSAAAEDQLVSADAETIASAEWAVIEEVIGMEGPGVLIVATVAAVAPVLECLQALAEPPVVLAADELPPDADLAALSGDRPAVLS